MSIVQKLFKLHYTFDYHASILIVHTTVVSQSGIYYHSLRVILSIHGGRVANALGYNARGRGDISEIIFSNRYSLWHLKWPV